MSEPEPTYKNEKNTVVSFLMTTHFGEAAVWLMNSSIDCKPVRLAYATFQDGSREISVVVEFDGERPSFRRLRQMLEAGIGHSRVFEEVRRENSSKL